MTLLGAFLKELRGTLSTLDVERETGIPRITISRYERGENTPSIEKLKQLSEFYECPYEKLRLLFYEDLLSNPEDTEILKKWAMQKYFSAPEQELIQIFRNLSADKQALITHQVSNLL